MTKTISAVAALFALGFISSAALAQDGLPGDPNSNQNTIPGPDATNPSDPAADDNPAARVPTSPPGTGQYEIKKEGSSRGTSGEDAMQKDLDDN